MPNGIYEDRTRFKCHKEQGKLKGLEISGKNKKNGI